MFGQAFVFCTTYFTKKLNKYQIETRFILKLKKGSSNYAYWTCKEPKDW